MRKTLYTGAVIVTMRERGERFRYMGVTGDRITYLGNEPPEENYKKTVDLGGKYIFPTLCDSHVHLLHSLVLSASAFNICSIDRSGITPDNMPEVEKKIRAYAEARPGQRLLMINQYIPTAIREKRLPDRSELDRWTGGRETVLFTMDGHSCALSTALLEKLKIRSDSGILSGEDYDLHQGQITGYVASRVSLGTLIRGAALFTNACLRYGISKVCALDGEEPEDRKGRDSLLPILVFFARRLPLDVRLYPQYMDTGILKKYGNRMRGSRLGGCSRWEIDGSVGSHSAAFSRPFIDTGELAKPYYPEELLREKFGAGLKDGIRFTCHAIGPEAIDRVLNAYENCGQTLPAEGPLCRIDHFEFPTKEAVERIKKLPLAITVQPGYSYLDKRYIRSYESHLCPEDIGLQVPLRDLMENGVPVLGSSDSPVQDINPYEQMHGMMDFYLPDQSLDAYDALKTYTAEPARALAEPEGILVTGARASFFVTSEDITALSPDDITRVRSERTYIGGKPIRERKGTWAEFIGMLLRKPKKI